MDSLIGEYMASHESTELKVWDPFVRVAHWATAAAFFIAYLTEDDFMTVHVWAGYVVAALVLLRILWGFVGPRHARFADFVYKPGTVLGYFWELLLARASRYVGHSPAGGAMVIALMACLALTVTTGLIVYTQDEGANPLAPVYTKATDSQSVSNSEGDESQRLHRRGRARVFRDFHELIANITLVFVVFHVLGVVLASFVHHENLVRAMITGRKRRE
jgi:cytochrome b